MRSNKNSVDIERILTCLSNRFMHMRAIAKYKFINKFKIEDLSHEKEVTLDFQENLCKYGVSRPNASKLSSILIRYSKSIQHSYFALWYSNPSLLLMENDEPLCLSQIRESIKANDGVLFKILGEARINKLMSTYDWGKVTIPCHFFLEIEMMEDLVSTLKKVVGAPKSNKLN